MNLKRFYTTFLLVISCYTMIYAASPKSDGKATKWSIEQANQWAAKPAGFAEPISIQVQQSISSKPGRPNLLIPLPSTANWVGPKALA